MNDLIEGFLGKSVEGKKNRMPAQLDWVQSATGLFLGLFMWGHLFFDSTIIISKDLMYSVTKMFEGGMFFDEPQPWIDGVFVVFVSIVFMVHGLLGMRKFPANFRQWQAYRTHMKMMKHDETNLWFIQAVTAFIMFFIGSAHLFITLLHIADIGPYLSAERMYDFWPFYLVLLIAVVLHGNIGLYRLCVKWGWFEGKDSKKSRSTLKKIRLALIVFFMFLGAVAMIVYIRIGHSNKDNPGVRYHPTAKIQLIEDVKVRS